MTRSTLARPVLALVLVLAACSPKATGNATGAGAGASVAAAPDAQPAAPVDTAKANAWTANGATACAKYVTPALAQAVLGSDVGPAKTDSPTSCHAGDIYISLKVQDTAAFRQQLPMIADVHQMSGVGEAAYWNGAGAVTAVSRGRECMIFVLTGATIHDEALAQKLGPVCNQLFALP